MGAIRLENNKIFRDVSRCKHCGRCATVCPNGAVEVFVDDAQATEGLSCTE
jgi:Fe-S-cluster-containing hydrogenase component 2